MEMQACREQRKPPPPPSWRKGRLFPQSRKILFLIQVDHYGAMLEALQDIYKEARNGNLPYKTLVIDTGDRLWDMCARQVIRDG